MKRVSGYRHLYRRGEKFIFRRGVPIRARDAFGGKHEVVASLRTNSLSEARFQLLKKQASFEATLSKSDRETGHASDDIEKHVPTLIEMEAAVRLLLKERMERSATYRFIQPNQKREAKAFAKNAKGFIKYTKKSISISNDGPTQTAEWAAETLISNFGWNVPEGSELHLRLLRLIAIGQIEASTHERQDVRGRPRKIRDQMFSPEQYQLDEDRQNQGLGAAPISMMDIFEAYAKEGQLKASTIRAWKRQITAFVSFIGHDDAQLVEEKDVFAWKDHLLSKKQANGQLLSARTVNDTYLAAVKATFNYAVETAKLLSNPAKLVRVRKKKKTVTRSSGLTDEEAYTILSATMQPMPPRLSVERALARRWVPWLCAYSGARVNEVTQLRRQDISQIEGIWTFLVTPDAGTVKTNKARLVPIHPHIIEQGFIEAIKGKTGPLFYDLKRRLGGSAENPQPKKVGEHIALWVRGLGVTDPEVQPNHGWRHRFKTLARRVHMDAETRDVIQGHKPRTEGEAYGDTEIGVLYDAIQLIPKFEF